jgi:hypothetical protein
MLNLTASNLTMYSVPPPGSGAVLAAILIIFQHSDNFQVRKGHAEPDHQQQPDHVQRASRYVKVTLNLTASSNLTVYSVLPGT